MSKRQAAPTTAPRQPQASKRGAGPLEHTIEDFAEDLGRLLGTARAKAENWLGQRRHVAKQLSDIRDTAADLLDQLTGTATERLRQVRRGGRQRQGTAASTESKTAQLRRGRRRKPGRPKGFKMSAEARQKIRDAWAKRKAKAARGKSDK
jgi:hypothetical protein